MANTILERIQDKYGSVCDDARNIAEALAMANYTGGRGAGAISDNIYTIVKVYYFRGTATGGSANHTRNQSIIDPVNLSAPSEDAGWNPPYGKVFGGWSASAGGDIIDEPFYATTSQVSLYAVWVDAE